VLAVSLVYDVLLIAIAQSAGAQSVAAGLRTTRLRTR
jgi:hypothetical protein